MSNDLKNSEPLVFITCLGYVCTERRTGEGIKRKEIMEILIQNKPPIDFGLGVHDNFRVWKLSLIFVDILVNIYPDRKSMLIGVGIPLVSAIVFSLNTENTRDFSASLADKFAVLHAVRKWNADHPSDAISREDVAEALGKRIDSENNFWCSAQWRGGQKAYKKCNIQCDECKSTKPKVMKES